MKKSPFAPGMAVFLCACLGLGAAGQVQTPTANHLAQAMALIDLMRRHGLETDNVPGTIRDEGKQGYRFTSPSVDLHDARYWEKKVTLKKVEATVYASEEHLKDLLKTMRGNGGFPPVSVACGEAWIENKAHFVPGQYEAIFAAGNVEVRIWFHNTLPDNNAFTPEKDEWYKQADAKHPAALRSLITAIASDVCRLGLDKPSSQASGGRPTTGTPAGRPSEPPPGRKDPCAVDRDALMAASLRARLSFANLSALRSAITQLDSEWELRRQVAFWSGTIDIAFMGGSALTKGITQSVTGRFVSQSLQSAVIESSLKGILRQGLKQYNEYCAINSIDRVAALEAMATKGATSAANKAAEDFITTVLERVVLDEIQAGRFGGLETLDLASTTVNSSVRGSEGLTTRMTDFVRNEYAAPAARFMGLLISMRSALDAAWTSHGKLENLRLAIKAVRDREIEAGRHWEQAMGDLDRMRSSFNYCQQLHPESPRDELTAATADFKPDTLPAPTLRRAAEPGGPAQKASTPADLVVLPYKSASLALRDGQVVVASISPEDIYYAKQGLVVGSRLESIDLEPLNVRSIEDLRNALNPPGKEMLVLGFVKPDGTRITIPIPLG